MNNLQWECHRFEQLTKQQLYAFLKLRVDVFVVEQQCPYPELDDKDHHTESHHLIAHDNDHVFAYCRLLPPGLSYAEVSLGRFVVNTAMRHQGLGSMLLKKSLLEANSVWPKINIRISAQAHLKEFYEKFGFEQVSDQYLEDNIPHIEMLKKQ